MKNSKGPRSGFFLLLALLLLQSPLARAQKQIPPALEPWKDWATWDLPDREAPRPYNNSEAQTTFWPSQLALDIGKDGGHFSLAATVFGETWVTLPGSREHWPQQVTANGKPVPVTERNGRPAVKLASGTGWTLAGSFQWTEAPQRFLIPKETGILQLSVNGGATPSATWDGEGSLWVKGQKNETTEKDFLSAQVYRALEDGIPLWLRTTVELSVSGKSREETLGHLLPEGWKLASVASALPVAIDESGLAKAQVRAGKWKINIDAFHLTDASSIGFAAGIKPAASDELIAFRAKPEFRLVEITGIPMVDVTQTTLPEPWRDLPVYRWETSSPFKLEERMRGMGLQKPEGLRIERELWLGESGSAMTFRDTINGSMQEIWRLDIAENRKLGSVRVDGQGQLVTYNPKTGAEGVELRQRNLNLQATGRMERTSALSATGWQTDAENVNVSLHLPPGWRLFAVFGADWVQGDWLTAWSLLDLFLLLVFSVAVAKLWNLPTGILAFFAFALAYHEPGSPRYVWFFLLVPLALARVVPEGWMRKAVLVFKYAVLAVLLLVLIPFVSRQIQAALYPQLEALRPEVVYGTSYESVVAPNAPASQMEQVDALQNQQMAEDKPMSRKSVSTFGLSVAEAQKNSALADYNMLYDSKARIQTGPGIPERSWNTVQFGWNGPVAAEQSVHPVLIPLGLQRVLILLRIGLLVALAVSLLRLKWPAFPTSPPLARIATAPLLLAVFWSATPQARAQFPDKDVLQTLGNRLMEVPDAFPNAADIPQASLALRGNKATIEAEIHAAARCSVPLPVRLPAWSPLAISIDGQPRAVLRREDGSLWAVLSAGVHHVQIEGLLAESTEWEWSFQLPPRKVSIDAPGWTHTGVRPNGVPEAQVFLTRQQKTSGGEASYDRRDTNAVVSVTRYLETGLVWKIRTEVERLSSPGKAVSLRIPLLPGENVLSSHITVSNNTYAEIRMGAQESRLSWESELPIVPELALATHAEDAWVECWHLLASPVWHVTLGGLPPVFEQNQADLTPVWHPWPGENATLSFSRPEAVQGETATVRQVQHSVALGSRQRTTTLAFEAECSLGQDFPLDLPAAAEVTSVRFNGNAVPVRKDGAKLIIALKPGPQSVEVKWAENLPLGLNADAGTVRFPVEASNITTSLQVPDSRWILWTHGPLQGPAVRFWVILACALLAACILARLPHSPLRLWEWLLLAVGLTQVHPAAALVVTAWFFLLAWRGRHASNRWPGYAFNLLQAGLILGTLAVAGILLAVVHQGLLGDPDMFILGNDSYPGNLQWYQASCDGLLPRPFCISVSLWIYRLLMLLWALWLAFSLVRWLKWAWVQFSSGNLFRRFREAPAPPPAKA
jgi:hypothetical protein